MFQLPIVPAVPHDELKVTHEVVEGPTPHYRADLRGPGGTATAPPIVFHKGSPEAGWRGWTTAHVIRALIAHLEHHETTAFACEENREALAHLRSALDATKKRAKARADRGVLYDSTKP